MTEMFWREEGSLLRTWPTVCGQLRSGYLRVYVNLLFGSVGLGEVSCLSSPSGS